jgi:hypothetical protein
MSAINSFQKALLLLDRGDIVRGEQILREVITSTEQNRDMLHYRACCCLGELLVELSRSEGAHPLLERVAALGADHVYDDVLDFEIQKARKLLNM